MLSVFLIILYAATAVIAFKFGQFVNERSLFQKDSLISYLESQLNELEAHLNELKDTAPDETVAQKDSTIDTTSVKSKKSKK